MAAAKSRGFEFRLLPVRDGVPSQQELLREIEKPGVRAVAISWVEFASGYGFDLPAIGRRCRALGIIFVVDAIQGLGPRCLDVAKCQIDILACGAQKWLLSPWGTGFLFVRHELIGSLEPVFPSWMAVRNSDDFSRLVDYDMTWRDDARRFELITLPFQEFAGLNASLELFFGIGPAEIARYTESLATHILEWAGGRGIQSVTPGEKPHRAGIVALRVPNGLAASVRLRENAVIHSFREGAIRLAPYFFNTTAELDRALSLLIPQH
jgi:selenocysteine lyase/cysteine desulfurase